MIREATQARHGIAGVLLALALGALPGLADAEDGWVDDEAAETTAGEIEEHEESSQNPDDMTTGSHDPDAMTTRSGTMAGREARSDDPDAMVTGSSREDEVAGEDLTDLPDVAPDRGFVPIDVPGQHDWPPTTNPEVLQARKRLLRAEKRAEAAQTAYGNMMMSNYPRGEARIRIVNERDAAMEALEEAKRELTAAENET
jgi:hypothetical protein